MTKLKLSKWVKRSAFTVIACAALVMISADQADAQYYGGRGFSSFNSFGGGFGRGYSGLSYGNGFSNRGFNNFNSGYRYSPQRSYYRGGGGFYGGGNNYYGRGRSNYYGRRY